MKQIHYFIATGIVSLSIGSCQLLEPDGIINPNVDEDTFLHSANAMQSWVNGTNRSFATAIGSYAELTEILSDNYFNNYSQSSKVFDIPRILYTDLDVTSLQRHIGTLRESAEYGLQTVAKADMSTTQAQLFTLYYIKAYAYLLAGEYFRGLPVADGGEIKDWREQLDLAVAALNQALGYASDNTDRAFINTLLARAYYKAGDRLNAVKYAGEALSESSDFVKQVEFDGVNGVTSSIQNAVWGTWFQPLPRLDFLDPKYFKRSALEERSICIAKAEEPYLILAEASLAANQLGEARQTMKTLLALVKSRPTEQVKDWTDNRFNGGYKHYPDDSRYRVKASPDDEFRTGLVLDRREPHVISVSFISGTSVTGEMIDAAVTVDGLLEVLYLMRQEIFFAEGRRASDLGFRFPVCEIEAAHVSQAGSYTDALIPPFIPQNQEMDAFERNEAARTVVIKYNMNRILVENKSSEYVAPFFN